MSVWEQTASLHAANKGLFDEVPVSKIKDVQAALLTELWSESKDAMKELSKGDKPTEKTEKVIEDTAKKVAKGFGK
jgi:F0F1-type ATP synthase alpha subunit